MNKQSYNSILETIGNTPIIALNQIRQEGSAQIYVKYEASNPSYSLKDRIALKIIESLEESSAINSKTELVAATAGNTGVALSLIAAAKAYHLKLFMPQSASLERRKMFEGFGVSLEITSEEEGVIGALKKAQDYVQNQSNAVFINQFDNPNVASAHRESTAKEVLKDFPDGIDYLLMGIGTGGTLTGLGSVLKERFKSIKIFAVEPEGSDLYSSGKASAHRIEQIALGFVPPNLDQSLIDDIIHVSDQEAYEGTRYLAKNTGILAGLSTGANIKAALKLASKVSEEKKILTFICDAGQRYFSVDKFFKKES